MALENISSMSSNSEMEDVFKKLECPFTWNMEKITKELVKDEEYNNENREDPPPDVDTDHFYWFLKHVMLTYLDVKSKADSKEIFKRLKKCDDDLTLLKKYCHPEISADVTDFILQSTKCFVFKELNLTEELEQALCDIKKDWEMNSKERSTLNACKSICWSMCHPMPVSEFECFIREAIKDNPNCDLYYFILGKNLKRKRKESVTWLHPTEEEKDSFLKAYNMSGDCSYGICLAHVYRELKKFKLAKEVCIEIVKACPQKPTVLLRLALELMHFRRFIEAKIALDAVETMHPERSMYLHYRGIYHMKRKEYKEAMKYLKDASSVDNIAAEKHYLYCAVQADKTFDIIQYLHGMINRYNQFPTQHTQQLLIDLALIYWNKEDDIQNALVYFLKAVEINPEAPFLSRSYVCKFIDIEEKKMYRLLNKQILPVVLENKEKFEQSYIDIAEELQKYCDRFPCIPPEPSDNIAEKCSEQNDEIIVNGEADLNKKSSEQNDEIIVNGEADLNKKSSEQNDEIIVNGEADLNEKSD